jgi:hypothetical protein
MKERAGVVDNHHMAPQDRNNCADLIPYFDINTSNIYAKHLFRLTKNSFHCSVRKACPKHQLVFLVGSIPARIVR